MQEYIRKLTIYSKIIDLTLMPKDEVHGDSGDFLRDWFPVRLFFFSPLWYVTWLLVCLCLSCFDTMLLSVCLWDSFVVTNFEGPSLVVSLGSCVDDATWLPIFSKCFWCNFSRVFFNTALTSCVSTALMFRLTSCASSLLLWCLHVDIFFTDLITT